MKRKNQGREMDYVKKNDGLESQSIGKNILNYFGHNCAMAIF